MRQNSVSLRAVLVHGSVVLYTCVIVSFWLPDRYRQDGAEAPSLRIAITPWFARRSRFGVREHSTPADLCKQVERLNRYAISAPCACT